MVNQIIKNKNANIKPDIKETLHSHKNSVLSFKIKKINCFELKNETYETTKEDSNNNTHENQKKEKPSSIETEGSKISNTPKKKNQNLKKSKTTS